MKMNGVCVCAWGTNEVRRGHVGAFKSCHPGSVVAVVLWARARESGRWGGERLQQNAGTPTDTTKKKAESEKKREESKRRGKRKHNLAKRRMTTDTQEDSCGQSPYLCNEVLITLVLCEWSQTLTIAQTQTQKKKTRVTALPCFTLDGSHSAGA